MSEQVLALEEHADGRKSITQDDAASSVLHDDVSSAVPSGAPGSHVVSGYTSEALSDFTSEVMSEAGASEAVSDHTAFAK